MDKYQRKYDPDNPEDAKILLKMMMEPDNVDDKLEFEDESDTNSDDQVEECSQYSETVQEDSLSDDSIDDEENMDFFIGKDKLTQWKKKLCNE